MSLFWRKFKTILWKNYILRKRKWGLTLAEFLFIVLAFYGIKYVYDVVSESNEDVILKVNQTYYPMSESDILRSIFTKHDVNIAYTPGNAFTIEIMNKFEQALTKVSNSVSKGGTLNIIQFDSEENLEKYFSNLLKNSSRINYLPYGIVFTNSDPKNFHYTLRGNASFNTHDLSTHYFPTFSSMELKRDAESLSSMYLSTYLNNGFLGIQLAIDKAFIEVVTKAPLLYQVELQQLPSSAVTTKDIIFILLDPMIPLLVMLCFVLVSSTVTILIEEKQSGVKERIQMAGLSPWMFWIGWLMYAMMIYFFISVIIAYLMRNFFSYTHWIYIFVSFLLFSVASVTFMLAIGSFFCNPGFAQTFCVFFWIFPFLLLGRRTNTSMVEKIVSSIFPPMAMKNCLNVMSVFQKNKQDLDIFSDGYGGYSQMSLGLGYVIFILCTIIYLTMTWYVDSLIPGPFGRAKPWYFIFQYKKPDAAKLTHLKEKEAQNFELPPEGFKVGIRIHNLCKIFPPSVVAVDEVNLDIYEGQITALLGHNGAGKTTTMSILAGLFSHTSGEIYADNYNIFEKMDKFQINIGLCAQGDYFFSNLTVIEHLIFFGMLKGLSSTDAKRQGQNFLQILGISEHEKKLTKNLSGGTKRKLSVAMALIGNPKIIILDEPSSGLDPESKRLLWNLLLSMREKHTIILSTHSMEEAEVLGDRIAIMVNGRIHCYGTQMFLKKIYGSGYLLTMIKEPYSRVNIISQEIQRTVDGAQLKESSDTQVTYSLSQDAVRDFPVLFMTLERKKSALGIISMGISCPTIEDVFIKVGRSTKDDSLKKRTSYMSEGMSYEKVQGFTLITQHLKGLILKKALFTKHKWLTFLTLGIIIIILPIFLVGIGDNSAEKPDEEPSLALRLSAFNDHPLDTFAVVNQNGNGNHLRDIFKKLVLGEGSKVTEENNVNITDELIKKRQDNRERYIQTMLVAAEFNSSTAKGLYSGNYLHTAPIALNLITQTILQSNPSTSTHGIFITNNPLNIFTQKVCKLEQSILIAISTWWLAVFPLGLFFFLADVMTMPLAERVCNMKQIQLMNGVHPILYWLSCFIFDYSIYCLITLIMVAVIFVVDTTGIFALPDAFGIFALTVLLFGLSGIPYAYMFSCLKKNFSSAQSLFFMVNTISMIVAAFLVFVVGSGHKGRAVRPYIHLQPWAIYLINCILCLNPVFAFSSACVKFIAIGLSNVYCHKCRNQVPKCTMIDFYSYQLEDEFLGLCLTFLALDWILYYMIVLFWDFGYIAIAKHWFQKMWINPKYENNNTVQDLDVEKERKKTVAAFQMMQSAVVVDGLVKKFSRRFAAVKNVSFCVARGECFGLLGVNGAGKTTTFRMLTGDEIPTAGRVSIFNYTLVNNRSNYLKNISYCPQVDALNESLTAEEMLYVYALFRGIPSQKIPHHVRSWITLLGLEEFCKYKCGTYSGGNKRKLCIALALIGNLPIVFLDEPTSGVDPISRRNVWNVFSQCEKDGKAIVLTSHSMEESEALCTRLTIMVKGQMMCIGSPQYIKQKFGIGYTIIINLSGQSGIENALQYLKQDIKNEFGNAISLKDEHKVMLHYHLRDNSVPLSQLFSSIESLKIKHTIVQDYTINNTTLEEVFLSFAKY